MGPTPNVKHELFHAVTHRFSRLVSSNCRNNLSFKVLKSSLFLIILYILSLPIYYTVSQKKNKQNYFCYNYVKLPPNLIIFGTKMAKSLKLYEVHSFSISPNSCQCTTVLSADAPNCYITLSHKSPVNFQMT